VRVSKPDSSPKERLLAAALACMWEQSYAATTVDSICARAGVKSGSFYYFFHSKSDLAVAALEADWQSRSAMRDEAFSIVVPPLERFRRFFDLVYSHQTEVKQQCGSVLGCSIFSLGCEICKLDEAIRAKVEENLNRLLACFESAIRDAHAAGLLDAPDARFTARVLFAYFEGVMTQARIENSLELLDTLPNGAFALLGVRKAHPTAEPMLSR
jgi:TetR/AcrR family transcriptional repressor of nem operon